MFPIAAHNLIETVGCAASLLNPTQADNCLPTRFKWTMRIIAFMILAALAVTNLTLERRLPPKKNSGPFINLRAFRSAAYSVYCFASFVSFLGLYTVGLVTARRFRDTL